MGSVNIHLLVAFGFLILLQVLIYLIKLNLICVKLLNQLLKKSSKIWLILIKKAMHGWISDLAMVVTESVPVSNIKNNQQHNHAKTMILDYDHGTLQMSIQEKKW